MTLRIPSARAQPTVQYVRDGAHHYLQIGSRAGPPRSIDDVVGFVWDEPGLSVSHHYVVFPDSFKGQIPPRTVFELVKVRRQEEVESDG